MNSSPILHVPTALRPRTLREKAPAAICRKVAMAEDGGTIAVWGDGTAIRSYTYVSDMVDGTRINTDHTDVHR